MFPFNNCGMVKTPKMDNMSLGTVGYYHSGQETSCSQCHERERPTSTAGFIGLNPNTPFDYDTHGRGTDCATCHRMQSMGLRNQNEWANGYFTHTSTLTSCAGCHSSQKPTAIINGFDHGTIGTTDCFSCHSGALQTNFSSMANWANGSRVPTTPVYDPNKDLVLPVKVPTFTTATAATHVSLASVASQNQNVQQAMDHATTQLTTAQLQNCTLCHQPVSAKGIFHSALTAANIAQPTRCAECHLASAGPNGFVGPDDTRRSPVTGPMLHDAKVWSLSAAQMARSNTALVTQDCAVCHKKPGNSWNGAAYHSTLGAANLGQPSSCLDCHANSRPTGLTASDTPSSSSVGAGLFAQMSHANTDTRPKDCNVCHTGGTVGSSWKNAGFHAHVSNPATRCDTCHMGEKPTVVVSGFSHSGIGTSDCKSCHTFPGTGVLGNANNPPNWKGAGGAVPQSISLAPPTGTNWGTLTVPHPSTTSRTGMNCATCHVNYNPNLSIKGYDHNAPVTGIKCVYCHTTNQQVVNSGVAITTRPTNHEGGVSPTRDCSNCHRPTYPTWNANTATFTGGQWDSP